MNVYLAASTKRQAELRGYAIDLILSGHHVTSSWIESETSVANDEDAFAEWLQKKEATERAERDLEDIDDADLVVCFAGGNGHGGRHVELGYALGQGKPVIFVGEMENVFHALEEVIVVPNWEVAQLTLDALADALEESPW